MACSKAILDDANANSWPFADAVEVKAREDRKLDALELKTKQPDVVQTSPWFKLPGEVRNIIYEMLTEDAHYEIRWLPGHADSLTNWKLKKNKSRMSWKDRLAADPNKIYTKSKADESALVRRKAMQLERRLRSPARRPMDMTGDAQWLGTCRMMHQEGGSYFYSRASFSFRGHKLLDSFVNNMTPQLAHFIQRVDIYHSVPGVSSLTRCGHLKPKVDHAWMKTVRNLCHKFPGLQRVDLRIGLNEKGPVLEPRSNWMKAIRPLMNLDAEVFDITLTRGPLNTETNRYMNEFTNYVNEKALNIRHTDIPEAQKGELYDVRVT